MGNTSSPDLMTRPFEPGMLGLVLQFVGLYSSTLGTYSPLLTLLTQMVGSTTRKVAYYISYPQTVVSACIHMLF